MFQWINKWFKQQPPAQPSESLEVLRLKAKLHGRQRKQSMAESGGWGDYFAPDLYQNEYMLDPSQLYSGLGIGGYGTPSDRARGRNWPFVKNENDLRLLRTSSRYCVTVNPYAEATLNGLISYVISTGYSATCKSDTDEALASECQRILSEWCDRNNWEGIQEEAYRRAEQDGECFGRLFPQRDGDIAFRFIEPECVTPPYGADDAEWSFGIQTDPEDTCNVKRYNVRSYAADGQLVDEVVKAKWVVHYKLNATAAMKRGIPSFSYATLESFTQALKLKSALGHGAAVQASICGVREHLNATEQMIGDFADSQNSNLPGYPFVPPTTVPGSYQGTGTIQPGTILDLNQNTKWVDPPGASAVEEHTMVLQALLRAAGSRWNAPEWLVSGRSDSMSYASSLTAESPFLRACSRRQRDLKKVFRDILEKVLTNAVLNGELAEDWDDKVSIDITPPGMEVRDIGALARANEIYHKMRVKSLRTICADIGINYTKERAYLEQEAKDMLQATDPLHNLNPALAPVAFDNGGNGGVDKNPSARASDQEVAGVDPGKQTPDADAVAQSTKQPVATKDNGSDKKKGSE